jgi:hypothetical protein
MKNQHKEDELKKIMLFSHIFKDEEIMIWLNNMFESYEYPNILSCVELYKDYTRNLHNK